MTEEVAGPDEVLRMITAVMRGTCADESGAVPKIAERFRAAELLAKRYGLLDAEPAAERREREEAAREIEAALAALIRRERGEAPSSTGTPSAG